MGLSLKTKILLLTAGTVTGLAALLLLMLDIVAYREIGHDVRRDVQANKGVLTQLIHVRSQALLDQCLLLAHQPGPRYLLGVDAATVVGTAQDYRDQMHADVLVITDRDGHVMGDTGSPSASGKDLSAEPGVAAALRGETWSGVVVKGQTLMMAVSVPVLDPVSKVVIETFAVYSAVDATVAQGLKQTLGAEVAFVQHGRVTASSLVLPVGRLTLHKDPTLVTIGGTRYFSLYAPLEDTNPRDGLGFVTLISYRRAMGLYDRFQAAFLVAFLITMPLTLGAGAGLARSFTRPLDGVMRAARVLREGGWPDQISVRRTDEIGLLQSVFNEMTVAMRSSQERLLALIDTDPLTGLDNHRRVQERLGQEAQRCLASGEALALLLLDFDHFQDYNARHGHAAGDEALKQVASLLRNTAPEYAILARYGGEEFAVLLPRCGMDQAERIAEQIRASLWALTSGEDSAHGLSLSIGCAEFGTHTKQAEGLFTAAELAVLLAKQLGRNRVCRFDSVPGADETADPFQLHRFLNDGSISTIQALAAAVDAKDPYTQGHSARVAEYARELAVHLNLTRSEIELIHTTGTLHDVGKIGVPDAILQKPARLEPEERLVMETHPVLGEAIVRKAPQLAATLPGVRHHHERWDGKGYPDGLAGEDIPSIARILALADSFDAMTSDRPYRKGLSWDVAFAEIERGAGTQFDPELVMPFLEVMRSQTTLSLAA